jgi:hypothetical protein
VRPSESRPDSIFSPLRGPLPPSPPSPSATPHLDGVAAVRLHRHTALHQRVQHRGLPAGGGERQRHHARLHQRHGPLVALRGKGEDGNTERIQTDVRTEGSKAVQFSFDPVHSGDARPHKAPSGSERTSRLCGVICPKGALPHRPLGPAVRRSRPVLTVHETALSNPARSPPAAVARASTSPCTTCTTALTSRSCPVPRWTTAPPSRPTGAAAAPTGTPARCEGKIRPPSKHRRQQRVNRGVNGGVFGETAPGDSPASPTLGSTFKKRKAAQRLTNCRGRSCTLNQLAVPLSSCNATQQSGSALVP